MAGPLQGERVADAATPPGLSIRELADTVVDDVITVVGRWGNYIHGKSYQQEALVTYQEWQYTTYYDAQRRLAVARRALPAGAWERIVFPDYIFHGDDNHNVPVIGICPADGTIHLAFDHHNHPLRYRVSAKHAAADPAATAWEAALFGPVVDALVPGHPIARMTYPRFVAAPDRTLYFFHRFGGATDGRIWLSRYDPRAGGWAVPWQITESAGLFEFEGLSSPARNAYLNNPAVDAHGRIHLSWIWRENGELRNGQHSLCYMVSEDGGKSFRNHRGEIVTEGELRAGISSPDLTVWSISPRRGLKNQQAMAVDATGRPHIVMWYLADAAPDLAPAAKDHTQSRFHHFWQTADGRWHKQELLFAMSQDEWILRPQLALGRDGQLLLIYNRDGHIAIAGATPAGGFTDWQLLRERPGNFTGEAKVDIGRLHRENVLSVYMHEAPTTPHEATVLHVVDFETR